MAAAFMTAIERGTQHTGLIAIPTGMVDAAELKRVAIAIGRAREHAEDDRNHHHRTHNNRRRRAPA
jgi:hypothetical protein